MRSGANLILTTTTLCAVTISLTYSDKQRDQFHTLQCEVCVILKNGFLGRYIRDSNHTGGNLFPLI